MGSEKREDKNTKLNDNAPTFRLESWRFFLLVCS
jgi:hypothetical protein